MATKRFKIWRIAKSDEFCCFIDARSEYDALRKYKAMLLSSGMYWLEKTLGSWALYSSYGAHYVAVETR